MHADKITVCESVTLPAATPWQSFCCHDLSNLFYTWAMW